MLKRIKKTIRHINVELIIWLAALAYLFTVNPYGPKSIDLCLFSLVGIENCPGCGLGRSVSMIFHGDFIGSFASHPLGLIALLLIIKRIFEIIKKERQMKITNKPEAING